jgi:hypothetical protein
MFMFSLVAAGVTVATPAGANMFKSYLNENVCIGVQAGNPQHGANIITWACDGSENQNWNGAYDWTGVYTQLSSLPGQCISVPRGQLANGAQLIDWDCSANTDDQYWKFVLVMFDANWHKCGYFENKKGDEYGYQMLLSTMTTIVPWPYLYAEPVYLYIPPSPKQPGTYQLWCEYW